MLFSNTLLVSASEKSLDFGLNGNYVIDSFTGTADLKINSGDYNVQRLNGNGSNVGSSSYLVANGNYNIDTEVSNYVLWVTGKVHIEDTEFLNHGTTSIGYLNFGGCEFKIWANNSTASSNTNNADFSAITLLDFNKDPIPLKQVTSNGHVYYDYSYSWTSYEFPIKDYFTYSGSNEYNFKIPFYVSFKFTGLAGSPDDVIHLYNSLNVSTSSSGVSSIHYDLKKGGNLVQDTGTQQAVEKGNEIADDTNETTHSIFDSISDFFGSFFSNLIGVFVPDSGYFEQWFSRVNTLLTDKLGILYFPFSFIIGFLTDIQSGLNSGSGVITFPAIEFKNLAKNETYHFTDAIQVNLGQYNPTFSSGDVNSSLVGRQYYFDNLLRTVRTINSMFVVVSLLMLFVRKLLLIIRGSEEEDN